MKKLNTLTIISFTFIALTAQARPTFGKSGLVVSASDLASQAGIHVLQSGGTAADAAVATYFVLAVTRPYYASLGGGGLLLARFAGSPEDAPSATPAGNNLNVAPGGQQKMAFNIMALDFREKAPHKATPGMFIDKPGTASQNGGLAVATPGNVAGIFALHKKYGKLSWGTDLAPAIEIAKKGFLITEEFARITNEHLLDFSPAGKKYFTLKGKALAVGDRFVQPQLADALEIIKNAGADGFYKNSIARDIVRTLAATGGLVDSDDFGQYAPTWSTPLHANVLGADIYSMPPPSSGGALILAEVKLSERLKLSESKPYSSGEFHLLGEIMSRVFFDRQYIADPKFTSVPIEQIFSDGRIDRWAKTINKKKKTTFDAKKFLLPESTVPQHVNGFGPKHFLPSAKASPTLVFNEKDCTTHFSVVDKDQNAVSMTITINGEYGSGVVTEKYGIVLNNEMDDFTTKPGTPNMFGLMQGKANEVAPLKTPLSSMTPTFVEKNKRLFLVVGAPGGPKIINAVYQTIYHALTTKFNLDEIVQMPRVHHQHSPDTLNFDHTLSPDTLTSLEKMGHQLSEATIARVYAIRVTPDGLFEGAFDNRGEGGAASY